MKQILQFTAALMIVMLFGVSSAQAQEPELSLNPYYLGGFSYLEGNGPSEEQYFDVIGYNLTSNVVISASDDYEISLTTGTNFTLGEVVLDPDGEGYVWGRIYVRMKAGLAQGFYSESIMILGETGMNNVLCEGNVTPSDKDYTSEVANPTSQIPAGYISSIATTIEDAEEVFKIKIIDDGASDGLQTLVTKIRLKPNTTNTADWTNTIQGLFVHNGTSYSYPTVTIYDEYIELDYGTPLAVSDNSSIEVTIYVYLNSSDIVDGSILSFMVDADDHGFTADASGSQFKSLFGSDVTGNDMTINIQATELNFDQPPSNVVINLVMTPPVHVVFTDANGNRDTDFNGSDYSVSLSTTGTFSGSATILADAVDGLATFNNIIFSVAGQGITITALDADGHGCTSVTSDAFIVYGIPNLIISEVANPGNLWRARFVELYNAGDELINLGLAEVYLCRQENGTTWENSYFNGIISPKETFVVCYSSLDFRNAYSCYEDGWRENVITGDGNDGYFLYYGGDHTSGNLIDAYGVIDENGTGKPWEYTGSRALRKSEIGAPNTAWTASEWEISIANTGAMTPGIHNGNISFKLGTGNWSSTLNWSNGDLPTSTDNVIIPTDATLSVNVANAEVNNINVQDGGKLTINSSQSLSVDGIITIEDGGSFINNGTLDDGAKGEAEAIMQRNIPAYSNNANGWHLISSPINDLLIAGSDFEPGSTSPNLDDLYAWDEDGYQWLNYKDGVNNITNFLNGKGYLASYETAETKDFTGTFNNSNITFDDLSVTSGKGEGWHLLGNPFQAALLWNDGNWALSNIATGAKIMNSGGTFTDIVNGGANQYIPANQGFFIHATNADNSITIPKAARTHNSTAFYKDGIPNLLTLHATDGEFYVETWVQIMEGATTSFDAAFDVLFFAGMYQSPYFYSESPDEEWISTNRIGLVSETTTIQLGFKSFLNKGFTISAENVTSFDNTMDIYLEDTQEGVQINLKETQSYAFDAVANETTHRFKLHLLKSTGVEDIKPLSGLNIYSYGRSLYFKTNLTLDAYISVFNITGQEVFKIHTTLDGMKQFWLNVPTGWYVVKVLSNEGIKSEKIFIR